MTHALQVEPLQVEPLQVEPLQVEPLQVEPLQVVPTLTRKQERMADTLRARGYVVGERNKLVNTAFTGRYMVVDLEGWDGQPTEDARSVRFAIVGNNLGELIEDGYTWDAQDEDEESAD